MTDGSLCQRPSFCPLRRNQLLTRSPPARSPRGSYPDYQLELVGCSSNQPSYIGWLPSCLLVESCCIPDTRYLETPRCHDHDLIAHYYSAFHDQCPVLAQCYISNICR